jgi:hypothetical protein
LLLIIASSIVGLVKSKEIKSDYEAVGCSVAITFNDLLNGNVSSNGSVFIGLQSFSDKIS